MSIITWFIATVVTFPLFGWYLLYIVKVKRTKNKRKSVRFASDWSTILFMASVYFIIYELWQQSLLLVVIAIFLLISMIFTWLHWYLSGDIHTGKLVKGIWRFNFIIFFCLHLFLVGYGLVSRLFEYLAI